MTIYKTYPFRGKDPVLNLVMTAAKEGGHKWKDISKTSGVSINTLYNWSPKGTVSRPKFATIQAVAHAIGYDLMLVKSNRQFRVIQGGKQRA